MERAISGPFAGCLGSRRGTPGTIVFFLILLIPGLILGTGIEPLSRAEESLPADHPFQRLWTLSGEKFPSSAQNTGTPVHLVWGVEGVNNDKVNTLRDGETKPGELVWDDSFVFDEAAQLHLYAICESVRKMEVPDAEEFLSRDQDSAESAGEIECPIWAWKEFLERTKAQNPTHVWPMPLANMPSAMEMFLSSNVTNEYGQNVEAREKYKDNFGYDPSKDGGRVRFVALSTASHLQRRASHTGDKLKKSYDHYEKWVADLNAVGPASANKAFQTSEGDFNGPNWIWMHTQGLFLTGAIQGAVTGTILAFIVILIATRQIIIAFAAFFTIASILVSVLAMMKLANYELGTITSICITILAGFAVDYVVHLAHAYNEAAGKTRAEKFQEAFDVIGVSVLSGMVTSVLAALVLLLCQLQFFAKFGFFLIFTVVWAWLWGNCFFMAIMKLVGPDESTHWLLQVPHSVLPSADKVKCCKKTSPE